jgi:pimeloyl-ACP methyl ester carboxylesterase
MSLLSYTDNERGLPIVFLHGFCEDKSIWVDFVKPLVDFQRLICIDLPNFGQSPAMPDATIEKMSAAVIKTLDDLGIEKCILIGHSLGGYVALAVAEFYPYRLLGLALFHSTAFADSPERKENRNKAIQNIKQNGVEPFVRALIPSLFSPAKRENSEIKIAINHLIEKAKKLPAENLIYTLEAMRNRKERIEVLKQVNIPILFLLGKDDVAVPLEASLSQCHLPQNSVVHSLAEVGHMGMIEAPIEFAKAIKNFVSYCK